MGTRLGAVSTFINMFSRTVLFVTPATTGQVRGMATLRDIQNRLKAVKNIQKITKSMKIVSAAKFNKAERELKAARPYGQGQAAFFESAEVTQDETKPVHLVVACSSDRGLCGGIHSNIMKAIRAAVPEKPAGTELKVIAVGDKQKALMGRLFADKVACHFIEIGKKPPVFQDAAQIAQAILSQDYDFGELYFNRYKTVVSYGTEAMPIYSKDAVVNAGKLHQYDSIDEDVLTSYNEFALANLVFFALREGSASELSARMTAMDAASKNAGEMIEKLTMAFNRKRQAVITSELCEIIAGASALD